MRWGHTGLDMVEHGGATLIPADEEQGGTKPKTARSPVLRQRSWTDWSVSMIAIPCWVCNLIFFLYMVRKRVRHRQYQSVRSSVALRTKTADHPRT